MSLINPILILNTTNTQIEKCNNTVIENISRLDHYNFNDFLNTVKIINDRCYDYSGVIVCGTHNVVEYLAYFLSLTVRANKCIVVSTPSNIINCVQLINSSKLKSICVFVKNNFIHTRKSMFGSIYGPIGYIENNDILIDYTPVDSLYFNIDKYNVFPTDIKIYDNVIGSEEYNIYVTNDMSKIAHNVFMYKNLNTFQAQLLLSLSLSKTSDIDIIKYYFQ